MHKNTEDNCTNEHESVCNCFLPLFIEGAAEGDVFLHCSVEQPGLLGSVGHRVSVLAEWHHGKQRQKNG